jgi:TIR domain
VNGSAPEVFVSYRREDTQVHAGGVYDRLAMHFGPGRVFIDADLKFAENFVRRITEVLRSCKSMVVMIGPRWATIRGESGGPRLFESRDFVRYEVELAMQRSDVKVIPVLVAGADMPHPDQLPESIRALSDLNGLPVRDDLRTRRSDLQHLITTLEEGSEPSPPPPPPSFIRPLAEGVVVAAAAGLAGGILGGAIQKTGEDDVTRILSSVIQRSLTWAVIGAAIAVWLTIVRGEPRWAFARGLFGLVLGALAGALGGAIFGAAVNLPTESLDTETQRQIQIGALAATGGVIGVLVGKLWLPARAGPGFLAGAAGGALAQILLNAGDWGFSSEVSVGFRCVVMVTVVYTTLFSLDALRTTPAPTGVRHAT